MVLLGIFEFRRARTTINPVNIEAASAIVSTGPLAFILFITRYQLIPEERVLKFKFADAYGTYQASVRPWL